MKLEMKIVLENSDDVDEILEFLKDLQKIFQLEGFTHEPAGKPSE